MVYLELRWFSYFGCKRWISDLDLTFCWMKCSMNGRGGGGPFILDSEPPSRMPNSLMPSAKLRSANLPVFYVFGVTRLGIEPRPPAPRADALTTVCYAGTVKGHLGNWNRALLFKYWRTKSLQSSIRLQMTIIIIPKHQSCHIMC